MIFVTTSSIDKKYFITKNIYCNFFSKKIFSWQTTNCSTISGSRLALLAVTTFPPVLKTLSDFVELAGIARYVPNWNIIIIS